MADASSLRVRDISKLFDGIRQFRNEHYGDGSSKMRDLVDFGQSPAVLMISCCDSRVDPALLTNAAPGELFTLRNIANLVPPYQPGASLHGTGAAIEYAVRDLKVDHIVVLGHGHCGGMKALLNAADGNWPDRDFVGDWVGMALGACKHYVSDVDAHEGRREVSLERLKDNPDLVERASVLGSLDNLMTYPWLAARVEAGELVLHGWWFDLESGDLWATEPGRRQLLPVD
jgi:carbonic anhydrase